MCVCVGGREVGLAADGTTHRTTRCRSSVLPFCQLNPHHPPLAHCAHFQSLRPRSRPRRHHQRPRRSRRVPRSPPVCCRHLIFVVRHSSPRALPTPALSAHPRPPPRHALDRCPRLHNGARRPGVPPAGRVARLRSFPACAHSPSLPHTLLRRTYSHGDSDRQAGCRRKG